MLFKHILDVKREQTLVCESLCTISAANWSSNTQKRKKKPMQLPYSVHRKNRQGGTIEIQWLFYKFTKNKKRKHDGTDI